MCQFLQSGSDNLFSVGNVFALFLNRILSAVDYLTYVITNILLLQWQLSLFSFILMCFFSAFTLSYTHALTLSVSPRKKECTSKTQQKNPESMCVKVNKIDQAKMNEILSLKFHTRTTVYKFKLYMSHSVRSIKFVSKESERKNTNQVLVRF